VPEPPFQPFGPSHGLALLLGAISLATLLLVARRGPRAERRVRSLLAFVNLAVYGFSQWAWAHVTRATDLSGALPLHLCDLAAFIAGFALITGNRTCILLTYYWGLAGTVQGLATPAIDIGFPHPAAFSFFLHHFAVVAAALYFPVVLRWRADTPFWRSPLRAFAWLNGYVVLAVAANAILGTNFGFLAGKPENPSLLDHLGPHPLYILWLELIALALFALLTLPVRQPTPGNESQSAPNP